MVTEYSLQHSGPVKKKQKLRILCPCSVLSDSNAPGLDVQFLKNTRAQKPGEGLLIHPQWPLIFYKALDQSKKLKNAAFTAYVVFYLSAMHQNWISNFLKCTGAQKPSEGLLIYPQWLIIFCKALGHPKNQIKSIVYSLCSILPTGNILALNIQCFTPPGRSKTRSRYILSP